MDIGPMKGGLSVGRRLEILRNVRRRLENETVSVRHKWSVECWVTNAECRCLATLIMLILGWMSVSNGINGPVSGVRNTPFMAPGYGLHVWNIKSMDLPRLWMTLSLKNPTGNSTSSIGINQTYENPVRNKIRHGHGYGLGGGYGQKWNGPMYPQ